MSTICSPIEEIDNLWLERLPSGKILREATVVRYDNVTVIIPKKGYPIYSSSIQNHVSYSTGHGPWFDGMMKCLHRAGVISKKAIDDHMARVKAISERQSKEWALKDLNRISEKFGIKFTEKQLQALK